MKISLAEISKIYQGYLIHERPAGSESCPALERIVKCVLGKVSRKERSDIVGHAAICPRCAAALKDMLDVSTSADKFTARVEALSRHEHDHEAHKKGAFISGLFRKPAIAVLAGVFAIAIITLSVSRLLDRSGTRGGPEARVLLISPVKSLVSRENIQFRWKAVANADYYTMELFDETLRLLWRSGPVMTDNIRPANDVVQGLLRGSRYFWLVTAVKENKVETKSGLGEFSIER